MELFLKSCRTVLKEGLARAVKDVIFNMAEVLISLREAVIRVATIRRGNMPIKRNKDYIGLPIQRN